MSPQTLSLIDRRLVASWAADCAGRVLHLFEADRPGDGRPRAAIERARTFSRGEVDTREEIRRRFGNGGAGGDSGHPAAKAAARSAGQAQAVCHMGAHALGAAAYAAEAVRLALPGHGDAVGDEIGWQLSHMTPGVRVALRALPAVGTNRAGPLGFGVLASGRLGSIIQEIQRGLSVDS